MTYLRRQNYRDRKEYSVCQGGWNAEGIDYRDIREFQGVMDVFYILIVMIFIQLPLFVKTHQTECEMLV